MFNRKLLTITGLAILVIAALLLMERCKPSDDKEVVAILPSANAYMGEQACKTCHASAYNEWMQSHHYKAMLPANDSTVLGNFNNTLYTADGVTSRFFRKDGKFYINTQGEDGKNHDYEVKYTFGFTPLQQYLVEFPGGRMQATRQCWDVKARKWFHQYAGQKLHHADWLHWTGNAQNWNTMCANCHSTNLKKNYTIDTDSYATAWDIINVSCESCHGPGKSHIDFVNSKEYKKGDSMQGSRILVAKKSEHLMQVNACAYCHARRSEISNDFIAGREVMDYIIPEIPSVQYFHADGQVNEEDYIYTSFLQSKMFRHGVQCGHCHNPHSGKKLFEGNALCTQCHVKKYDDPAHTFHPTGSKSPDCVSCHMPGKYFMGNDYRHDHSFRTPRPDLSLKYATPNACNNCHTDKNAQWAAAAIEKWYGPKRAYHFAEDLVPGSRMDQNSEAHLLKLLADTSIPAIVKATAAHYLENHPTNASQAALIKCLSDTNAQLRYRALRSLSVFPSSGWLMQVGERLSDPVKAVRLAAADLFLTIPAQQVPTQFAQPLALARSELDGYLRYQADFAVGNLQIADHYLRQQDYLNAEKFYQRALKKDSLLNYARLNLSSVYNAQGKNQQALQALLQAVKIDPSNDRIYYNLALLYAELKNEPEAKANFEKAVQLKSTNPRLYYNYGLLLMQQNEANRAEAVLLKGLGYSRDDAGLHYALAFLYLKQRQPEKALPHARFLKQIDPSNPEYAEIFRTLRL